MIHFLPDEERVESTRTRVLREPELIPIQLIRPTEAVSPTDCRQIRYSPICLVKHSDGMFYIVDGNHRFHKKATFEKECPKVAAWILREGDQDKLKGECIPEILKAWKAGKITLDQLAVRARFEWDGVKDLSGSTLTGTADRIPPSLPSNPTKKVPNWPAEFKLNVVIQLLKKELSIEGASSKYSIPIATIQDWLLVSYKAMCDALQD